MTYLFTENFTLKIEGASIEHFGNSLLNNCSLQFRKNWLSLAKLKAQSEASHQNNSCFDF